VLRPILPHTVWQAITAFVGFFTLVFCAVAAPVDLWRLTVKSHQGEPFLAIATLASLPEEHISSECLSMGPESDAPGSEMPFLRKANLKLAAKGDTVEISTDEPVGSPALALVLRVQCAGAPLYARHFSALIPPALAKIQAHRADAQPAKGHGGFHLSLLPDDTVESVAAVIFPAQRGMQQDLVQQVIAGNPKIFPNGRAREVPAGTVLWFPDLREIRKSTRAKSFPSAKPTPGLAGTRRPGRSVAPPASGPAPAEALEEAPAKPHKPVTLRRALELGDKPGAAECRQLMQLCGVGTAAIASVPPLDDKALALESGVKALHLKQEGIEQQLERLELSLQALQKVVNSAPVQTPAAIQPAPPPAKVEIRTIVKSEPLSWTIWLGLAGLIVAAAIGGFAYGRRGSFSRGLTETDEQLDRMLATAATVMRELESTPKPAPPRRIDVPMPPRSPRLPPADPTPDEPATASRPAAESVNVPDFALDTQAMQPTTSVDLPLESEPAAPAKIAGLSNEVLFEMDQALDNTRSMFTDVDRFIALGRTQNALSLLQFQVHKDPRDRDSWIKLMAIYRQEKMDGELTKAAREFKNNFPNENPPAV
jgi:hypothetical protein